MVDATAVVVEIYARRVAKSVNTLPWIKNVASVSCVRFQLEYLAKRFSEQFCSAGHRTPPHMKASFLVPINYLPCDVL